MRKPSIVAQISLLALLVLPSLAWAQAAASRLTDKDVEKLIEEVKGSFDRFDDRLDGKVKDSILRGTTGEVQVKPYLKDHKETIEKLKDRFSKQYAASSEAERVLRQATDLDALVKGLPPNTKGRSEWDRYTVDLGRLADVYRTAFPLRPGAPVRRINDDEAAKAADDLAKEVDKVRDALDKEKSIDKTARDAARRELEELAKQAKTVKSLTSSSKPATGEATELMNLVQKFETFAGSQPLSPATASAWAAARAPVEKLRQAFAIK